MTTVDSYPPAPELDTRARHPDKWAWLMQRSSKAVHDFLVQQNVRTARSFQHLTSLASTIHEELTARAMTVESSLPLRRGDWWYFVTVDAGDQYVTHRRCPAAPASWDPPAPADIDQSQVVFDLNSEAARHTFVALGGMDISVNGDLLCYLLDETGSERYTLRIRDLTTGTDLPIVIADVSAGAFLSSDGQSVIYLTPDSTGRPYRAYQHSFTHTRTSDILLFEEHDRAFRLHLARSRSGEFIFIHSRSKSVSEVRIVSDVGAPRLLRSRTEDLLLAVDHARWDDQDCFVVLEQDPFGATRLVIDPIDGDSASSVYNTPSDIHLTGIDVFATFMVVECRTEGQPGIGIVPITQTGFGAWQTVEAEDAQIVGLSQNPSWLQPTIRIGMQSFVIPPSIRDFDPATMSFGAELIAERVRGGFDPSSYEQRTIWADAPDGVAIPISVYGRRDALAGGLAKVVLSAYGAYGVSSDPNFSAGRLSLLDRGIVFAVAHVRGGGELGPGWHRQGKQLRKRTSITDFLACAAHLIGEGYTSRGNIIAQGDSAGGLIVGAVLNQDPGLLAGALLHSPFVDPVQTLLDPDRPLTATEWDEWGNPGNDEQALAVIRSYSPYDNVRSDISYPPVLVTAGVNDARVLIDEPARWIAKLQAAGAPALLRVFLDGGHGGQSGRSQWFTQTALEYAWICSVLGATHEASSSARSPKAATDNSDHDRGGRD